jgi:UDP-N-acetylmuramoyl-L-alanyl-D-glutamate--2,6-diaminopimelate ligase
VDFAVTPGAFNKLLKTARKMAGEQKVILVLGSPGSHPDPKIRNDIGKIVSENTDLMIVTDDEPYYENPSRIRSQILDGAWQTFNKKEEEFKKRVQEISDRRVAIKTALRSAEKGDVVIIAGMGHLQSRNIGGNEIPWSDADVVYELLESFGFSGKKSQ